TQSRCSEDLLRNKIKALEAQLQACLQLQKFPKDGVKKLVVQMEKQRMVYEEKALIALQKATQEKTEALSKAETLQQEALITAKAEALKWQSLHEELKLSSGKLRESHHLSNEQLQQLHSQCEELQAELHTMEQECQSSQARLSQCRDELRQLSHRRRGPVSRTPCGSWWKLCLFFLLLLAVAGVVMLWLWHPPFREQVEDLYSDIETRIEDYLMKMASPRHSGCFRPI
uniref:TRAF3 interacting protein 3 n=1 Tax=Pundamilia nyererei TaxID=303518 RepID=A0A3B4FDE9_9CICH